MNLYGYVGNNPVRYTDPTGLKLRIIVDHGGEREFAQVLRALRRISWGRVSGGRDNLSSTEQGQLQLTLSSDNWTPPTDEELERVAASPCPNPDPTIPHVSYEARLREFRSNRDRLARIIQSEDLYVLTATTNEEFRLFGSESPPISKSGAGTAFSPPDGMESVSSGESYRSLAAVLVGSFESTRGRPLDARIYHELVLHGLLPLPDPDDNQYTGQLIRDEENLYRRSRWMRER